MEQQKVFGIKISSASQRLIIRFGIISLAVLLALSWLGVGPALAASVTASAASGPPGTSVTVSGTGFTDGDTYSITFAPSTVYQQVLASLTTITGTTFSRTVTIPTAPWAQYTIQVVTNRGTFNMNFQVTPQLVLAVSTGSSGSTVTASGQGFRGSSSITIVFNGSNLANTTSDSYGNLNPVDLPVPSLPRGAYNVYATDAVVSSPNVVFNIIPLLTVSPTQGTIGTQVIVNGTSFGSNYSVNVYFDSHLVTSNVAAATDGSFTVTITVPTTAHGTHQIMARDTGLGSATASFTVNAAITLSPATGAPGSSVSVMGTGFRSGATVKLTYNGVTIATQPATITTDSNGGFTATLSAPSGVAGSYAVIASDGVNTATATFGVASNLVISPTGGHVGSEVIASGSGFTPGGHVALSYDNQSLATATADSTGAFSVTFNALVSPAGTHTISARDLNQTSVVATATFTMESTPPPAPSPLTPQNGAQTDTKPLFSWSPVTDPSGVTYDLQVARDSAFTQLVIFKQGLAPAQYQLGDAEALQLTKKDSPYYWRVQAVDGAGNASGWTTTSSFYTQDSTAPAAPGLLTPPNDTQASTQPAFTWLAVTDPSGVTYNLQVALDTAFTRLVFFKQGLTQAQYQVTSAEALQLTKRTVSYYWRVQSVDGANNASAWSTANSFYTQDSTPPQVPAPLSPENGSRTGASTSFDWTDVSDPSGVTYTFEVAQDTGFASLVVYKEGLSASEYKLTADEKLTPSTGNPAAPYYWRVSATDGAQNASGWSVVYSFYVRGFQLGGWLLVAVLVIGGVLLLALGIFIGMKIRPSAAAGNTGKEGGAG